MKKTIEEDHQRIRPPDKIVFINKRTKKRFFSHFCCLGKQIEIATTISIREYSLFSQNDKKCTKCLRCCTSLTTDGQQIFSSRDCFDLENVHIKKTATTMLRAVNMLRAVYTFVS